jgi:hypothetical protein
MAGLFSKLPAIEGRGVRGAELVALWVKPGHHFNACYRLSVGSEQRTLLASAFAVGRARGARVLAEIGAHRAGTADPAGCPHCGSHLAPPGVLLQLFPFDYRLPTLAACMDARRVSTAADIAVQVSGSEPSGYRPGMRCQIHYEAEAQALYGKVAVERSPGRAFALQERMHAALIGTMRRFRVPAPVRYVPELHLSLVAAAAGESVYDALHAQREIGAELRAVARVLGDFHSLDIAGVERVYGPEDDLMLIDGWCGLVAELCPGLAATLAACQTELVRTRPERLAARAFVHRDFYDKQVLLSPNGVTLLDMDTACHGDPEIDLGNFAAQLRLRGRQRDQQDRCRALEEEFLASYPCSTITERVTWYRRSALLRLACYYALRPHWHHLAQGLIEEATA